MAEHPPGWDGYDRTGFLLPYQRQSDGAWMWVEWYPPRCGACGGPLGPDRMVLHWRPCRCPSADNGGHRVWTCNHCGRDSVWRGCSGPGATPEDIAAAR